MKLTAAQRIMLLRLAVRCECVPGGYAVAGRVASAWYRTARALESRGLVRFDSRTTVAITDAGRAAVSDSRSLSADPDPS
jgi:hypothetical protein